MKTASIFLLIAVSIPSPALARTWYITPDGMGDAPTMQAGIDSAAAGDTVLVAAGTYTEVCQSTPDGPSMLVIDSGLNLISESGPEVTILDAQGTCRVVYVVSASGSLSVDGFTVTGGDAGAGAGGGVYCGLSRIGFSNCVFSGNTADWGGGIYAYNGVITVADCEISDNLASSHGGGAFCGDGVTLAGCAIKDNHSCEYGGGIADFGCEGILGCEFSGNSASIAGGAVYIGVTQVMDCLFTGHSGTGSCVYCEGGAGDFYGCIFWQNSGTCVYATTIGDGPTFEGCTFYRNSGVAAMADNSAWIRVTNCTVYGQQGDAFFLHGAMVHGNYTRVTLTNTIVAYTSGGHVVECFEYPTTVELSCCCLYGNEFGDFIGSTGGFEGVLGNFSACPSFCFADATPTDLRLCDGSPCLPGNHPDGYDCGLIGAWGEGCICGPTRIRPATWGSIKSMYR